LSQSSFYRERDRVGFYAAAADGARASSVPGTPRTPMGTQQGRVPSTARDFADVGAIAETSRQRPRGMGLPLVTRSDIDLSSRAMGPEGYAVLRPSPARTPTTGSVNASEVRLSMPRGEQQGSFGLIDGESEEAPPTPPLPLFGPERGRLMMAGARGSPAASRGSGGSRFREGI